MFSIERYQAVALKAAKEGRIALADKIELRWIRGKHQPMDWLDEHSRMNGGFRIGLATPTRLIRGLIPGGLAVEWKCRDTFGNVFDHIITDIAGDVFPPEEQVAEVAA